MSTMAVELLRATLGVGVRLVGIGRAPLALASGQLGRRDAPVGVPVRVRCEGADVAPDPESLCRAFPHATDRLVCFVPSPEETEDVWSAGRDVVGVGYPDRLAALLDWTPLHLRVDPDLEPDRAGVELAAVLQRLVEGWPTDVRRIVLVGHGAGGLAIRAAGGVRSLATTAWTDLVSDVVLLGTPHLAVPARGSGAARRLEEQLTGITTTDVADPDVAPLDGARYAVVTDRADRPSLAGALVGNLLWWRQRATLRPRNAHALFPTASLHRVGGREAGLTNHPEVHRALLDWLA